MLLAVVPTYAATETDINIYSTGDCPSLIAYKGIPVRVMYVEYTTNGVTYPAYCLDKTMPGVEQGAYNVTVNEQINDVGLWRVITNGYPYKTLEELGVNSKEEAFTATKQAIYCYIHGNNPYDYSALDSAGIAGERTLNALHKILNDANNSNQVKISNNIEINKKDSEWAQDEKNKEYMSKIFSVSAEGPMDKYEISIMRNDVIDIGGIKITDIYNNEKTVFESNEKFKVLIPIKNMEDIDTFELSVKSQIMTKPVFYGIAPQGLQNHAITAAMYEEGAGNISDSYPKNETKITIIKQDQETLEKIEDVEFQILNENNEVIYSNLKTDENGIIQIENIIPGKYYIQETVAKDGYIKLEEKIEIELVFNEQFTVTVNNLKEEEPDVEIEKIGSEIEISSENIISEIKKLPKTGM